MSVSPTTSKSDTSQNLNRESASASPFSGLQATRNVYERPNSQHSASLPHLMPTVNARSINGHGSILSTAEAEECASFRSFSNLSEISIDDVSISGFSLRSYQDTVQAIASSFSRSQTSKGANSTERATKYLTAPLEESTQEQVAQSHQTQFKATNQKHARKSRPIPRQREPLASTTEQVKEEKVQLQAGSSWRQFFQCFFSNNRRQANGVSSVKEKTKRKSQQVPSSKHQAHLNPEQKHHRKSKKIEPQTQPCIERSKTPEQQRPRLLARCSQFLRRIFTRQTKQRYAPKEDKNSKRRLRKSQQVPSPTSAHLAVALDLDCHLEQEEALSSLEPAAKNKLAPSRACNSDSTELTYIELQIQRHSQELKSLTAELSQKLQKLTQHSVQRSIDEDEQLLIEIKTIRIRLARLESEIERLYLNICKI